MISAEAPLPLNFWARDPAGVCVELAVVLSGYSGFLPQSKDMQACKLIVYTSKHPAVWFCLWKDKMGWWDESSEFEFPIQNYIVSL